MVHKAFNVWVGDEVIYDGEIFSVEKIFIVKEDNKHWLDLRSVGTDRTLSAPMVNVSTSFKEYLEHLADIYGYNIHLSEKADHNGPRLRTLYKSALHELGRA